MGVAKQHPLNHYIECIYDHQTKTRADDLAMVVKR